MANDNYPNVGRLGQFSKGHYVICRFGYRYLACRPADKPNDPLLSSPLKEFLISATYAEQFLQNLHQWKNEADIVNKIFDYIAHDEYQQTKRNVDACIKYIASELLMGNLLIIPLDNR